MYKSETPVQDAVFGTKPFINWKLLLCVFLTTFVSSTFIDGFIGSTIVYTLAGFGLYVWLLILHQLFRMSKNSKKEKDSGNK